MIVDRLSTERPVGDGESCFTGDSSSDCVGLSSPVACRTSGTVSAPSTKVDFDFVGEAGGVKNGRDVSSSKFLVKKQLCDLRGDPGVLGENQPSVLTVFVGDKGGVTYPDR